MGTILVIDDNDTIREGLAHTIKKMGHTPVTAASGSPSCGRSPSTTAGAWM